MDKYRFRIIMHLLKLISVAVVTIGVVGMSSMVPVLAATVLSAGKTVYPGETVTIDSPLFFLGSGSVTVYINQGTFGPGVAGTTVDSVQGTENGNSVTFTLPAYLSVPSGSSMYFLIMDVISPYFTPNYVWGGSPPVGSLPEVPVAGVLPVLVLTGLAIVANIRRRRCRL